MKYKITKEDGIIRIFDNKGNKIYYEDSDGKIIDNKPKEDKIIEAKNLDECLKKLKEKTK